MKCIKCGKTLNQKDIGAYKKFVNRGASEFECISCLCVKLKIEKSELESKIEFLRKHGCILFN